MILSEELNSYGKKFQKELYSILAYWMKYSIEKEGDGFYPAVDIDNNPVPTANKSCVLNSRILWTFSAAAKKFPAMGYEEIAHRALNVIEKYFEDKQHGGFYMELSSSNKVVSSIKHTYAQAFILYSLCKYYEFQPSKELLDKIRNTYYFLDKKTKDPNNPGYIEAFTREWKVMEENRMSDENEPKSLNTHLHILEGYTAVLRVLKDDLVLKRLKELMQVFIKDIIRKNGHLGVFFMSDFKETEASKAICLYGHDIKASWLLWEAAEVIGDEALKTTIKPLLLKMADSVLRYGVDKDGGLFLESTRYGSHVRTNKHWWLQAENLVGFMNAFTLTGDDKYWEVVKQTWNFVDKHIIDHEKGEWFTKVNRAGKPYTIEPPDDPSPYYRNDWKIDPWKAPYHNSRAMMELIDRIHQIIN